MDLTIEVATAKELFTSASSVVILLPETAGRDAIAAGLALYLSLLQLKKTVTIAYPKQPIVDWSHLVGVNKLTQKLGNKNFVISLDYVEGSIEKVSYHISGNKFNLVIEPRPNFSQFSQDKVAYSYSGLAADMIITIGAEKLESLGSFYTENRDLFSQKPIVVFDKQVANTQYGKVNIVRPVSSISELMVAFLKASDAPQDADIASNLYDGILSGSQHFSSPEVTADTFEMVAYLLRIGARKPSIRPSHEEVPRPEFASTPHPEAPTPPPDWLKPKIYKGSTLL